MLGPEPVEKLKPRVSPKLMSKSKSRLVGVGMGCLGVVSSVVVEFGVMAISTVVVEDEPCGGNDSESPLVSCAARLGQSVSRGA